MYSVFVHIVAVALLVVVVITAFSAAQTGAAVVETELQSFVNNLINF
jgi:hypothetical protein